MKVPAVLSSCLLLVACAEVAPDDEVSSELGSFEITGIGGVATRSVAQVIVGTAANRVEMTYSNIGSGVAGCGEAGIFCVDVTLRSHYATQELRSLTVSLDKLTPLGTVAANGSARPGYLPTNIRDDLGLWVYGDLGPGESKTRQWRFPSSGRVAVTGRLFADVAPVGAAEESSCTNGSDDDGDRKLDCADADCTGDTACCNGDPDVCDETLTVVQVSAGWEHTCILLSIGNVRCWGNGEDGRLGYGSTDSIYTASSAGDVELGGAAVQVASGVGTTCALLDDGALRCWGARVYGALGGPYLDDYSTWYSEAIGDDETPASVPPVGAGDAVTSVIKDGHGTCVINAAGNLRCWGWFGHDEMAGPVVQVVTGIDHRCVLLGTGRVRCWGHNNNGGLLGLAPNPWGTGGLLMKDAQDLDIGGVVTQIAAGWWHTCALLDTGSVRCWGGMPYSYLQPGETPASKAIDVGGTVTQIVAGDGYSCALLVGGTVRCWGMGEHGALGYGNVANVYGPGMPAGVGDVPIGGAVVTLSASSAGRHTCALLDTGAVRCWGRNSDGQLGYGHTNNIGDNETPASAGDVPLF